MTTRYPEVFLADLALTEELLRMGHCAITDTQVGFDDFGKFTATLKSLLKGADAKPELQASIIRRSL